MTVSASARASHAYQATLSVQDSSGKKKAAPNTSPVSSEPRSDRPDSATTSRAGPATASGQIPAGGNAAARASPPARAAGSAQVSRSGGASCGCVACALTSACRMITYAG